MAFIKKKKMVNYKNNQWGYNSMDPTGITIHQTANDAPAVNEANYVYNKLQSSNSGVATWHYAIDEKESYQILPTNINGWHSGDGDGDGNRQSLGIEICQSTNSSLKDKCISNGILLAAELCRTHSIAVDKIYYHKDRSGKNCPHDMLDRGKSLSWFRGEVSKALGGNYVPSDGNGGNSGGNSNNKGDDTMYKNIDKEGQVTKNCDMYPNNDPNDSKVRRKLNKGEKFRIVGDITRAGIKQYVCLMHDDTTDGCIPASNVKITGSNTDIVDKTIND